MGFGSGAPFYSNSNVPHSPALDYSQSPMIGVHQGNQLDESMAAINQHYF